ncbi:uncharacterized protein LOC135156006 [Lytechinus pictus]|uniref:uncharacterized protein LOC135156006 n=1 Tax=Lytechinus pictus TaxID=7653 RepID=UPI0030B9CF1A
MVVSAIKFIVVEKFEVRRRSDGSSYMIGMVLEGDESRPNVNAAGGGDREVEHGDTASSKAKGNPVMPCYVNECEDSLKAKILQLEVGKKAILTNVMRFPSSFKSTPKSKVILNVCNFRADEGVLERFIRPEVVSVAEARGSPSKRRLSVAGDIVEVGPCANTTTYKRRSLQMEGAAGTSVEVVLWGEAALKDVSCGKAVTITAVVKDGKKLSSTPSTRVESSSYTVDTGIIVGMEDVANGYPVEVVLENGDSLFISDEIPFDFGAQLPLQVKYKAAHGGIVESITTVDQE